MSAFYNEIELYPAHWLRNLIDANQIANGVVDTRSIVELKAQDLHTHTQAHFFAGIGVWSYALRLAGVSDDVPVWTGSCPCQPFSNAGKRKGFDDDRHLWPTWFKLIQECRPPIIFGEQVASLDGLKWFDAVSTDLENAGYAVAAADLCAAGVGAPHIRQRLYFVGYADGRDLQRSDRSQPSQENCGRHEADHHHAVPSSTNGYWYPADWLPCRDGKCRPVEPGTFPLVNGVTTRVDQVRAYGNAIVAEQAATFVRASIEALT